MDNYDGNHGIGFTTNPNDFLVRLRLCYCLCGPAYGKPGTGYQHQPSAAGAEELQVPQIKMTQRAVHCQH